LAIWTAPGFAATPPLTLAVISWPASGSVLSALTRAAAVVWKPPCVFRTTEISVPSTLIAGAATGLFGYLTGFIVVRVRHLALIMITLGIVSMLAGSRPARFYVVAWGAFGGSGPWWQGKRILNRLF
jgi:ABC-type branched-subunit amino acid transport system permease subunit